MINAAEEALPRTLGQAVKGQFARAFHTPYETPIVVVINGLLMTGAWFLLPSPNPLFTFHGALAFPMILASWMYSDVPATNVLGSDATRTIAALDNPSMLRRLLYAKNIVLWILIAPLCALVAVGVGLQEKRLLATVFSVAWIAVVPLGALGISAWVGIYFPYHPLPLGYRWQHRRPFKHMIVRWLTLAVVPYGLVPLLTVVLSLPTLLLWYLTSQRSGVARIPDGDFTWGVVLGCVVAISAWIWGHRMSQRIAHRRGDKLIRFLANPDSG